MVLAVAWGLAFACGIRWYIVMSGSMEPDIRTGSVCFVDTRAVYEEIREGDVIAFYRGSGLVTHRVIAVTEAGLETKGDANPRSDGITVAPDNFHGKTVGSLPYAGYVLYVLKKPEILWISCIAMAVILLWNMEQEDD